MLCKFALNEASYPSLKFYNPILNTLVVIACHKSLDSYLKRSTCVGYLHQHEIKELNILHHFYNVMTAKDSDHLTLRITLSSCLQLLMYTYAYMQIF